MSISEFVETYLITPSYEPYEFDRFWAKNWLVPTEKKSGWTKYHKYKYIGLWKNKFMPNNSLQLCVFMLLHHIVAFFIIYLLLEFLFKFAIYTTILWNMNFCFPEFAVINSFFSNQLIYILLIKLFILRDILAWILEYIIFNVCNNILYWNPRGLWIDKYSNLTALAQIMNLPRWCLIVVILSIVLEFYTIIMNLLIVNIYSNIMCLSTSFNFSLLSFFNFNFFVLKDSLTNNFDFSYDSLYIFYYWYPEFILFIIIILNFFIPYINITWYKSEKYLFFLKLSVFLCLLSSCIYFLEFNTLYLNKLFYLHHITFFFQFCILFILLIYLYNLNLIYYLKQNINGKYYKNENFYFYEFYSLLFAVVLIGLLSVKSNNLFFLWFNMEILSILAYFLSSFGNSDRRLVSSLVYFVFNSLAGGLILFGIIILLNNFSSDYEAITSNFKIFFFLTNFEYKTGVFFILIGFLIKLGLFPFHFWNIKSYSEVTPRIFFFFVLIYKIILFFLFYRLSTSFFINIFSDINSLLILCCIISSVIGGVGACYEISLQKFLAYTSLVQSAYIAGGYLSNSIETITSALLYTICYFVVFLGFYLTMTLLLSYKNLFFSDLPVLYYISPFTGLLFIFYVFLFIGIPPSILFFAKFILFLNIFFTGHYFMFFVFLFVSIFTAIYYLNVIVSLLQSISKKSINNLDKTIIKNNTSEQSIYYENFAIDTKEFYMHPITYDFNKKVWDQQPTQIYKIIEFFRYEFFIYSLICYFFWLILYFFFITILTIFFFYFYNLSFLITENLVLHYNFFLVLLPCSMNIDIVTTIKRWTLLNKF